MTVSSVEIMGQTLSMAQASFIEPYYDQGWFNGLATYYYERTTRFNHGGCNNGNVESVL